MIYLLLSGTVLVLASIVVGIRRTGVVPMPSSRSARRLVAQVVDEYPWLTTVVEFGSGWGGLARVIARRARGRATIAIERSLVPHLYGRAVAWLTGVSNLTCRRGDFSGIQLGGGTGLVTYLSGDAMLAVRSILERDQPERCVLLSIGFAMAGWTPTRVLVATDLFSSRIYVYELSPPL